MKAQELEQFLNAMAGRKVLVVGDVGLDEYVSGLVRRISPEAPVPILEVQSQDVRLGLSANVAQNVVSLGGKATLLGVIGQDETGARLRQMLSAAQIEAGHLVVDAERPTTRKLRVMSGHHHLVRVDFELKKYLAKEVEERLLSTAAQLIGSHHVVVLEDYAKGVLSENILAALIHEAHRQGKPVLLDPNPHTPARYYRGVDLLTPNRDEAIALSGLDADELRQRPGFVEELGAELRRRLEARHVVITRGPEGMSWFSDSGSLHLPTYARQVFDVTGAGDTVIAALALAWAGGVPLDKACVLANFAAGVVVGKVGCVPCTVGELKQYVAEHA